MRVTVLKVTVMRVTVLRVKSLSFVRVNVRRVTFMRVNVMRITVGCMWWLGAVTIVALHTWMTLIAHIHEWVMSQKRMSPVTHGIESCHAVGKPPAGVQWPVRSHTWKRYVVQIHEWVMSHVWTSRVTYMHESRHTVASDMVGRDDESCHTHESFMSYMFTKNESCHTCKCVMSHVWMCHFIHMNESCYTVASDIVGRVDESCHTHGWVMSHMFIMDESFHIYAWVMSHISMSHVTHMNESRHTVASDVVGRSHMCDPMWGVWGGFG